MMLQITPNNKKISDVDRAKIEGKLTEESINNKLIGDGYHTLTLVEQDYVKELIGGQPTDEQILDYCKTIKINHFNKLCESKIIAGFNASNGHKYRTNRDDQTNMIGQKDELTADSTIANVDWKTEDVGYITHTREEWLTVYNEAFVHKKTQLFTYNSLKMQVLNATTHEEVATIKWV
jgi:hypothetical protein